MLFVIDMETVANGIEETPAIDEYLDDIHPTEENNEDNTSSLNHNHIPQPTDIMVQNLTNYLGNAEDVVLEERKKGCHNCRQ